MTKQVKAEYVNAAPRLRQAARELAIAEGRLAKAERRYFREEAREAKQEEPAQLTAHTTPHLQEVSA